MRSLIGLKNMIMFSVVLLSIGSVSAQQAFAGFSPIAECTITQNQMVNTQIPSNGEVTIPKTIVCDGNIEGFGSGLNSCVLNDPANFSNIIFNNNVVTFDETITNDGNTSEEHCELDFVIDDDFGNQVIVTQELWINVDRLIGGTVGSMSATSLLVAGAQANMGLWSMALVGIVGAAAAITYKFKSKKTKQ